MEQENDFEKWNVRKQEVHISKPLLFAEKEIWWCQLGVNIGSEQNGKGHYFERPVLVIKKIHDHVGWVFPLSSKIQVNKYRFSIPETKTQVIFSQIRTIDSRRLLRKIKTLDPETFQKIIDSFVYLIKNETPLSG